MTGWEFFADIIKTFSPAAITVVVLVAVIVFIVGFWRRGMSFIKYGNGQTTLDDSLKKYFDEMAAKMATKEDLNGMSTKMAAELETIKVNHFGHLKNFLSVLTSILLDKGIINNENKAQLDNQLRDM
jgi:predicted PurR-regulated permease PerM